jgi:hypothetical protein
MSSRLVSVLFIALTLVAVAACASTSQAEPSSPIARPRLVPVPTPVPTPVAVPTPTPSLNAGAVDGVAPGPDLSIEFPADDTLQVTLQDARAKAWRLVVSGTGEAAQDRLEIVVETGDIGPGISVTEIQQGEAVSVMDLSGYLDGTAAAGGCHATLPVCIDSTGFQLPANGNGLFAVRLRLPEPSVHLVLTGATATWPAEPFVLGPWIETEPFPWGEG